MQQKLLPLALTLALSTLALLGLAPTAAADDCGDACVENCYAGVGMDRVAAQCDVGHQPTGTDACLSNSPCGDWIVRCTLHEHGQDPYCDVYPVDTAVCVAIIPSGEFQTGACADLYDDCWAWTYSRYGTQCHVGKPVS